YALTIDHRGGRAGLSLSLLSAFHVERMMDPLQHPVVVPAIKIIMHRAAWREVLRDVTPLTAGTEDIHEAIQHLADVDRTFVAARFGWRYQSSLLGPLLVRLSMCSDTT